MRKYVTELPIESYRHKLTRESQDSRHTTRKIRFFSVHCRQTHESDVSSGHNREQTKLLRGQTRDTRHNDVTTTSTRQVPPSPSGPMSTEDTRHARLHTLHHAPRGSIAPITHGSHNRSRCALDHAH